MAEPETLAELGDRGQHALEVFLDWVSGNRTGSVTFHFNDGVPQQVETTDKVTLGSDDRPLTVVD